MPQLLPSPSPLVTSLVYMITAQTASRSIHVNSLTIFCVVYSNTESQTETQTMNSLQDVKTIFIAFRNFRATRNAKNGRLQEFGPFCELLV